MIESELMQTVAPGRGIGLTELLHGTAGGPLVVLFAIATQLGDVWLFFLLGGSLYLAGEYAPRTDVDRSDGLFVFSLLVTYIALVGVLKGYFGLPRPSGAAVPPSLSAVPSLLRGIFVSITTASGFGFPSGHALGTTMVWGGVALVLDKWTLPKRVAVAAGIVLLVSASRLVLGVHFLVDVIAGITVGVVALAGLYWLSDRGAEPGRVLGVAVLIGAVGLVRGMAFDSVAALASAVSAWLVWRVIRDDVAPRPSGGREVAVGFAVLLAAGALFGYIYTTQPSYAVTFVGTAATVGAVVAAPLVGEWAT